MRRTKKGPPRLPDRGDPGLREVRQQPAGETQPALRLISPGVDGPLGSPTRLRASWQLSDQSAEHHITLQWVCRLDVISITRTKNFNLNFPQGLRLRARGLSARAIQRTGQGCPEWVSPTGAKLPTFRTVWPFSIKGFVRTRHAGMTALRHYPAPGMQQPNRKKPRRHRLRPARRPGSRPQCPAVAGRRRDLAPRRHERPSCTRSAP